MKSLLDNIMEMKKLWAILMPKVVPPDDRTFGIWLAEYSVPLVEHALVRCSSKFRTTLESPDAVYRYASGVMKNEAQRSARETAANGAAQ